MWTPLLIGGADKNAGRSSVGLSSTNYLPLPTQKRCQARFAGPAPWSDGDNQPRAFSDLPNCGDQIAATGHAHDVRKLNPDTCPTG